MPLSSNKTRPSQTKTTKSRHKSNNQYQVQPQFNESNPTDQPHSQVTKMNPWKPGFSRWNNTVSSHQSQRTITSCLWRHSSRIKLLCGGDLTIKDRIGEFTLQP